MDQVDLLNCVTFHKNIDKTSPVQGMPMYVWYRCEFRPQVSVYAYPGYKYFMQRSKFECQLIFNFFVKYDQTKCPMSLWIWKETQEVL